MHADHQFAFDRPKLDMYVARIFALLNKPYEAEERARIVIDQAMSPGQHLLPPTRESFGRLDLASALVDQNELEEAAAQAAMAFGDLLRNDVLKRAGEVGARLRSVDPAHPSVVEYQDRYRDAVRRLSGR